MENKKLNEKSFTEKLKEGMKGVKGEFKLIIWPSWNSLFKQTFTVIAVSLIMGAIMFGYNVVFALLFSYLEHLFA